MTNAEKFLLSQIADDGGGVSQKRLNAIDALASGAGLWNTRHFHTTEFRVPKERERKTVIRLLRKLAKTKKFITPQLKAGIAERLLFLRGSEALSDSQGRKWLWRNEPDVSATDQQPQPPSPVVQEIEAALRKFREEQNGSQNTDQG